MNIKNGRYRNSYKNLIKCYMREKCRGDNY